MTTTKYIICTNDINKFYTKSKTFAFMSDIDKRCPMLYRTKAIAESAIKNAYLRNVVAVPVTMVIECE